MVVTPNSESNDLKVTEREARVGRLVFFPVLVDYNAQFLMNGSDDR